MYTLDPQSARKADAIGNQIKEIGKYVGAFTQAVDIKTAKGGKGVAFVFKSSSGQKANLAVYTMSAEGEKYQGYDALMAIMTCMGLRDIKPKPGTFTKYDFDKKEDVQVDGSIFSELCKPIGVLLETEDYEKQDGSTGTRMVMKAVFQAATELTASEILDRKQCLSNCRRWLQDCAIGRSKRRGNMRLHHNARRPLLAEAVGLMTCRMTYLLIRTGVEWAHE